MHCGGMKFNEPPQRSNLIALIQYIAKPYPKRLQIDDKGVPQGSILGPQLFTLNLDTVMSSLKCKSVDSP